MAAVTIPVLEMRSKSIILDYHRNTRATPDCLDTSPVAANLPVGFRALWLHTGCIHADRPEKIERPALLSADVAETLCQLLGLAPDCYQEFRLMTFGQATHEKQDSALVIKAQMRSLLYRPGEATRSFDSLQAVAAAMQRVADAYGLAVSMSDDDSETYVLLTRVKS